MDHQTSAPAAPAPATPRRGRAARVLAVLLAVAVLLAGGAWLAWRWLNPFGERTSERAQPVVLQSVRDLGRFEAATGEFQVVVVVDLEKDAPFLPDSIKGRRTLFVGVGSVDAYVDFSALPDGAITVSRDRSAVTVRLPRARLEKPNLDNERSYVFAEERGLLDRIGDLLSSSPNDRREVYLLAERKIAEAAESAGLRGRAEQNAKTMLEGVLRTLGFTRIEIVFEDPA